MKKTAYGRQPQNIKSGISQQPLIGSYSNFKLRLRQPKQSVQILQWRWPPMEDNLELLKAEYISNHILDSTQILNLSLDDQIILYKILK